jgi:hypothetical protein
MIRYTFADARGVEQSFSTTDAEEARTIAQEQNLRAVRNVFEFSDSETAWDFTHEENADGTPQETA